MGKKGTFRRNISMPQYATVTNSSKSSCCWCLPTSACCCGGKSEPIGSPPQCGTKHGTQQWINTEISGLICGFSSWFFLIYGMYVTTFKIIWPLFGLGFLGIMNTFFFNTLSVVAIYSHWKAMTTDPGSVPLDAKPLADDIEEIDAEASRMEGGGAGGVVSGEAIVTNDLQSLPNLPIVTSPPYRKYCKRCKAFKPVRAHHCSICGRCVVKMDHHCPWVNNCVGIGNHKLFLLFIFWVNIVCCYAIILIIFRFFSCMSADTQCLSAWEVIHILCLLVESILCGLFTICMLGDQASVVATNYTQIDRLKNSHHELQVDINEVFGCSSDVKFQFDWLLPIPVTFSDGLRDKILGYRLIRDCHITCELDPLLEEGMEKKVSSSEFLHAFSRDGNEEAVMEVVTITTSDDAQSSGPVRKRTGPP